MFEEGISYITSGMDITVEIRHIAQPATPIIIPSISPCRNNGLTTSLRWKPATTPAWFRKCMLARVKVIATGRFEVIRRSIKKTCIKVGKKLSAAGRALRRRKNS